MADNLTCFVIAPIGKEGSDVRMRSDKILNYLITPVAKECGYEALRADKISEPGLITTQVINHIINDPMVVADLTGENANVFYEIAVRHATHKPYVQLIQKGDKIPFDLAGVRTIEIDITDIESVEKAKVEMKKQMAMDVSRVESPISVAIDFDRMRRSDDPTLRELADIRENITELTYAIREMEQTHKRSTVVSQDLLRKALSLMDGVGKSSVIVSHPEKNTIPRSRLREPFEPTKPPPARPPVDDEDEHSNE